MGIALTGGIRKLISQGIGAITGKTDILNDPNFWRGSFLGNGRQTDSGIFVSPNSSMEISAYYACISNISEDIAKLPLFLYEQLKRGKEKAVDHPLFLKILKNINPNMTNFTFWELLMQWALAWGNGYAEIQRDQRGRMVQMNPIHPGNVRVRQDEDGTVYYQIRTFGKGVVRLELNDVFHIRPMGDQHLGFSTTRFAAESIGLAAAQQQFSSNFYGNNAMVSGVLQHPGTLKEDAAKAMRESWQDLHGGVKNSNKVAILWEGMTFSPLTMPMRDAELIASRKFSVEEIARWFRMPPHKIGHLEKATFSNIEMQSIEYVGDTLMPWLKRIAEEMDRKLLDGEGPLFVEHFVLGLLRGDSKTRSEYYNKMYNMGALNPNEIRDQENLNPYDGGDVYYVMVNVQPVGGGGREPSPSGAAPVRQSIEQLRPVIRAQVARLHEKECKAIDAFTQKSDREMAVKLRKFYSLLDHDRASAFDPVCESIGGDQAAVYISAVFNWSTAVASVRGDVVTDKDYYWERQVYINSKADIDLVTSEVCGILEKVSMQLENKD